MGDEVGSDVPASPDRLWAGPAPSYDDLVTVRFHYHLHFRVEVEYSRFRGVLDYLRQIGQIRSNYWFWLDTTAL